MALTPEQEHAYAEQYTGMLLMSKRARDYRHNHSLTDTLNHELKPPTPFVEDEAERIQKYAHDHLAEFCRAIEDATPGEADDVLEIYMDGLFKYPPAK